MGKTVRHCLTFCFTVGTSISSLACDQTLPIGSVELLSSEDELYRKVVGAPQGTIVVGTPTVGGSDDVQKMVYTLYLFYQGENGCAQDEVGEEDAVVYDLDRVEATAYQYLHEGVSPNVLYVDDKVREFYYVSEGGGEGGYGGFFSFGAEYEGAYEFVATRVAEAGKGISNEDVDWQSMRRYLEGLSGEVCRVGLVMEADLIELMARRNEAWSAGGEASGKVWYGAGEYWTSNEDFERYRIPVFTMRSVYSCDSSGVCTIHLPEE